MARAGELIDRLATLPITADIEAPLKDPDRNIFTVVQYSPSEAKRWLANRSTEIHAGDRRSKYREFPRHAGRCLDRCLRFAGIFLARFWGPGDAPAVRCHLPFNDLATRGRLKVHASIAPLISLGLLLIGDILFRELGLSQSRVSADAKHCDRTGYCCPVLQHRTS